MLRKNICVSALFLAFVIPTFSQVTEFAVIGGYGVANENEASVAQMVKSWKPDFIITLGGNNYPGGEFSTIDANIGQYFHEYIYNYQGIYGAGAAAQRFFPSLGEQDYRTAGAAAYMSYFTLPGSERYYDFARGDVHFFVLDSNRETPDGILAGGIQAAWLKENLAAATETWKIVYFHHSPYSSGAEGSSEYMRWSFKEWGATAVLTGQNNGYERLSIDEIPFIVNGLGGKSGDDFGEISLFSRFRYNENFGAMRVEANSNIIQFQFYNRREILVDSFALQALAAPVNLSSTLTAGNVLKLSWTDAASAEQGFRIEKSADGQFFVPIGTVPADQTSFIVRTSPFDKSYYRVKSFRNDDESLSSNVIIAKTKR
jgi:hypothetical protein